APAHPGVFLEMTKAECQFLNGTERVRFLARYIHNREQYAHFDSDLGVWVADTPLGELQAQYLNSQPELLEQERAAVDTFCRHNYEVSNPFLVER
ncbi:HB2J protein, partial [Tricholaema leucomelas]|nr:HB2J protein [Tricholaema leucomelas]